MDETRHQYIPALRFGWLTGLYDPAIRWTDLFGNPLSGSPALSCTLRYAESTLSPGELGNRLVKLDRSEGKE